MNIFNKKMANIKTDDKKSYKVTRDWFVQIDDLIEGTDLLRDIAYTAGDIQSYALNDDDIKRFRDSAKEKLKQISKYEDKHFHDDPILSETIINDLNLGDPPIYPFGALASVATYLMDDIDYKLKLEKQLKSLLEAKYKADPERKALLRRFSNEGITRIWARTEDNNGFLDVIGDIEEIRDILNKHDNYIFEQVISKNYSKASIYEDEAYSLQIMEDGRYSPNASKFEIRYAGVVSASVSSLDCVLPAKGKKHE